MEVAGKQRVYADLRHSRVMIEGRIDICDVLIGVNRA